MVTTMVSGEGCCTSMLPPPEWAHFELQGVTCPVRFRSAIDTSGAAGCPGTTVMTTGAPGGTGTGFGSWALKAARGRADPTRAANSFLFISQLRSEDTDVLVKPLRRGSPAAARSVADQHVQGGGQEVVLALEGPRIAVVVVADLRPHQHRL